MSKKSRGGLDSAFAAFDKRRAKYRPDRLPRSLAMDEHTRRPLRCDSCTARFEPNEMIWVGQDNTHHCSSCGSGRGLKPDIAHERMFAERSRRSVNFKNIR